MKETEVQWKNQWGGEMLFSHGSPNSCATAISGGGLETIPITHFSRQFQIPLGHFITLKVQINDKVYVVVNIYAPNKDKDLIQFFRKLHGLLQTKNLDSEENIVLGGDFNCPLNPGLDKHGGVMIPRRAAIDSIETLQSEPDLVDILRIKNP